MFAVVTYTDSSFDIKRGLWVFVVYSEPISYGSVLLCEVNVGTTISSDGKLLVSKDFETLVIVIRGSGGIHVDIVVGASLQSAYRSITPFGFKLGCCHNLTVANLPDFEKIIVA